jgi:hypothetical protein
MSVPFRKEMWLDYFITYQIAAQYRPKSYPHSDAFAAC